MASSFKSYWYDDFRPLKDAGEEILRALREDEANGDLHRRMINEGRHLYSRRSSTKHVRSIPIPNSIREEIQKVKTSSAMGLLPEQNLAWVSVDHKLFLFSTESENDEIMSLIVKSGECIVSIGVAPPKKGVFLGIVNCCLVVATTGEILLCALASKSGGSRQLIETRFSLPLDSAPFLAICGLADGRIFLGGRDGSLYEFTYESLIEETQMIPKTAQEKLDAFYDGNPTVGSDEPKSSLLPNLLYSTGKRTLRTLTGSMDRPRKCRKLDHSSSAVTSMAKAIVPEWLMKVPLTVGSVLFGATEQSSIIKMVHDKERDLLFTLLEDSTINVYSVQNSQVRQKCSIHCVSAARRFLTAVAQGRMFGRGPDIEFLGGGYIAQAGVGGMEGARSIIKLSESGKRNFRKNCLTPISIHVIPRKESAYITLLVISAGGLRYYLTTHAAGNMRLNVTSPKVTLLHIRSPPPADALHAGTDEPQSNGSDTRDFIPSMKPGTRVDSCTYYNGNVVLALLAQETGQDGNTGNLIVSVTPSLGLGRASNEEEKEIREYSGGILESVNLPTGPILAGGRIADVCSFHASNSSSILRLATNSKTPSDGELSIGLVPVFDPRNAIDISKLKGNRETKSPSSSAIIPSGNDRTLASSLVWTMLSNFLLSRPMGYGMTRYGRRLESVDSFNQPLYRLSKRYGQHGFSRTAGGKVSDAISVAKSSASNKSARLSPWLLRPSVVSLNGLAVDHLLPPTTTIAMSVSGLHFFETGTILSTLADILMNSKADVGADEHVSNFFESYGIQSACALCLMLAIGWGPEHESTYAADELKARAKRAALYRAHRPQLTKKKVQNEGDRVTVTTTSGDELVPAGYDFVSSFLYEGLKSLISRLLRPIWFKPAVVVTEGQKRRMAGKTRQFLPAKVELLLDDDATNYVRDHLLALQKLMMDVFSPVVKKVPGVEETGNDGMDVDDANFISGGILFNSRRAQGGTTDGFSGQEAENIAHLIEERNIHSFFRLLARSIQMLKLLSLLKRAHVMSDLPEVEWGLLHGLTICQLVQHREGHERIDSLLNTLVNHQDMNERAAVAPSAEAINLTKQLSTHCYLYFSPGANHSMHGFRAAQEAISRPAGSIRTSLLNQAITHFGKAARYWKSPQLITGRLMGPDDSETFEEKANRALRGDSPVARAAQVLMHLGEVVAVVDICTTTASNFSSTSQSSVSGGQSSAGDTVHMLPWERSLYHNGRTESSNENNISRAALEPGNAVTVYGSNVTEKDAATTCFAIVLSHLVKLLSSKNQELVARMISACAAVKDKNFLAAFYEHLLKHKHEGMLLKISSADLEKWLEKNNSIDKDLLRRYYTLHGKYRQAGDLVLAQATETKPILSLDDRITLLSLALNSFETAKGKGESGKNLVEIKKLCSAVKEHAELARLQLQTLQSVIGLRLESSLEEERLQALRMTLLPASELYNDFAAKLSLYDVCLRILHSCRHEEVNTIEMLWKSLIGRKILPVATRVKETFDFLRTILGGSLELTDESLVLVEPNNRTHTPLFEHGHWLDGLKQALISLGCDLYGTGADYVFPIEFLVYVLEELRHFHQGDSSPWPLDILMEIDVPYSEILDVYADMLFRDEMMLMAATAERRFLASRSIVEVIERWASSLISSKRALVDMQKCHGKFVGHRDRVASALNDLGAGDPLVREVLDRLQGASESIRTSLQLP